MIDSVVDSENDFASKLDIGCPLEMYSTLLYTALWFLDTGYVKSYLLFTELDLVSLDSPLCYFCNTMNKEIKRKYNSNNILVLYILPMLSDLYQNGDLERLQCGLGMC